MLIIFEKNEAPCCVYVPDDRVWKLEVVFVEDSVESVIRFTADGLDLELLSSLDYYDLVQFPENGYTTEDEAVQALLCQILVTATHELVAMAQNKEVLCLDLRSIVEKEIEIFIKFWNSVNKDKEEN